MSIKIAEVGTMSPLWARHVTPNGFVPTTHL
ncbi:hypothetical protein predicted by Glimmer/Critica (plasmid) [Sinorhizobium fredii HH103]|uniref:Uncharacterized protein n=1 Tax=Sinorhizobium fredii (strain HH103) TaxID=1117943 RepID=G9AGD6_SINF1|nr:hypothetical protein predicted by Glimmer/Critica [Sinorhizobium fredii HH103]